MIAKAVMLFLLLVVFVVDFDKRSIVSCTPVDENDGTKPPDGDRKRPSQEDTDREMSPPKRRGTAETLTSQLDKTGISEKSQPAPASASTSASQKEGTLRRSPRIEELEKKKALQNQQNPPTQSVPASTSAPRTGAVKLGTKPLVNKIQNPVQNPPSNVWGKPAAPVNFQPTSESVLATTSAPKSGAGKLETKQLAPMPSKNPWTKNQIPLPQSNVRGSPAGPADSQKSHVEPTTRVTRSSTRRQAEEEIPPEPEGI